MKHQQSPLTYPVVIRQVRNMITVSVPDLGISIIEELPNSENKANKDYVTVIGKAVIKAWAKAEKILLEKKEFPAHIPEPSSIKNSIQKAEQFLTPNEFAKIVKTSKNTIIRDCKKGIINFERTSGGHFKIPNEQILTYKEYLKRHKKYANEEWLKSAMRKMISD